MPKFSKLMILVFCSALITWSCSSDNLEDLTKDEPTDVCDTSNVTFSNIVGPLITDNCATSGCHVGNFPSATYDLSTYEGVKNIVDKSRLFGVLSHSTGFSKMPQGKAQLDQCSIDQVKAWIDAGAPNN